MSSAAVFGRSRLAFCEAAEIVGQRLGRLPSALLVYAILGSVGAFLLAALMVSLGIFISRTFLSISEIARADVELPRWLANHRTPVLTEASSVGYLLTDAWVLGLLVGASAVALVLARRWRGATFLVLAALVEVWGYFLASAFARWRSSTSVGQDAFPWISFPAGRVAAAIAIYGALAFLLSAEVHPRWARSLVWVLALGVSLAVAASQTYRGHHHLVDIAGGAAMGIGALVVALFAEHVAGIVAAFRQGQRIRAITP